MAVTIFATINASGLAKHSKRNSLDMLCHKLGISICTIQESNLVLETYQMTFGRIVGSRPCSAHAGLAVWFANNLNISNLEIFNVVPDSIQEISFFMEEDFFIIYNLHLPHTDSLVLEALIRWIGRLKDLDVDIPLFGLGKNLTREYTSLFNTFNQVSETGGVKTCLRVGSSNRKATFIVMGDFNLEMERVAFRDSQCKKKLPRSIITTILSVLDLAFLSLALVSIPPPPTRGCSIIDYICTPKIWSLMLISVQVVDFITSDHSMVVATFSIQKEYTRPPYWRMKNSLLSHLPYEYSMMNFLTASTLAYPSDPNSFIAWWDKLKEDIIVVSKRCWHKYSRTQSNPMHKPFQPLNKGINHSSGSLSVSPKIRFLKDSNGVIIVDQKDILGELRDYYSSLFSVDQKVLVPPLEMTFGLPKIDKSVLQVLDAPITVDDLFEAAVTMNREKAPGKDGISLEFYIKFWQFLGPLVLRWFGHVMSMGRLSGSAAMGVISLINKPGDHRLISNWRPIMLLPVELKIVAKAITNKIQPAISTVLTQHQTAMPGNSIFNSHSVVRDVISVAQKFKFPLYLTSLDQCKAFDNVAHTFLFHLLETIGLPRYYLEAIKSLYSGFKCVVKNISELSDPFEYSKGIRQGDPMSTCLFSLVLQPLLNSLLLVLHNHGLRTPSGQNIILTAYADDITLFLSHRYSIHSLLQVFNKIAQYSGACLNVNKSQVLAINTVDTYVETREQYISLDLIPISHESIKILGIVYRPCLKICPIQWQLKIDSSFRTIANKFQDLTQMSYHRRALWAKNKIWPRWTFLLKVLHPSKIQMAQLQDIFTQVIWLGARHWLRSDTLAISIQNGGLNALSPVHRISTMRVVMLAKIIALGKDSILFQLAELILGMYADSKMGFKILHSMPEEACLQTLPSVYASAFVAWNSLPACFLPKSVKDILEMPVASSRFLAQLDEPIQIGSRQAIAMGLETIQDLYDYVPSSTRQSKLLSSNIKLAIDQWVLPPWPDNLRMKIQADQLDQDALCCFGLILGESVHLVKTWTSQLLVKCFRMSEEPLVPNVMEKTWKSLLNGIIPPSFVNHYWRFLHSCVTTPKFYFHMGLIDKIRCMFCSSLDSSLDHQFRGCPSLVLAKLRLDSFIKAIDLPFLENQYQLCHQSDHDHKLANFLIVSFIYTICQVTRARANSRLCGVFSKRSFHDRYIAVINGHLSHLATMYPVGSHSFSNNWSSFIHKNILAYIVGNQLFILSNTGFVTV